MLTAICRARTASGLSQWSSSRHDGYATTDLAVRDVAALDDAARPLLETAVLRGVAQLLREEGRSDAEAEARRETRKVRDIFVARYDGDAASAAAPDGPGDGRGQRGLARHVDGSRFSFNCLLSQPETDFGGGGTRFFADNADSDAHVDFHPLAGDMLVHRGGIEHEGLPVTRGTRFILVGFLGAS